MTNLCRRKGKQKKTTTIGVSECVVFYDTELRILWANEAASSSIGLAPLQLKGKHCYKIWRNRSRPCKRCPIQDVLKTGQPQEVELASPEGEIWFIRIYPTRAKNGQITGAVGLTLDITQLKKAGETLQKSEERFRQVAENAQEWIWEVDRNGLYTYVSPTAEKVLGYKSVEIVEKKHFYDLFHPKEREKLKREAFRVFSQKQSFREFVNPNLHKNGKTIWLSTSGVPILDEKGNLLGYRGADTDITARKRIEERLKKLTKELLRTNKKMKRLALRDPHTGLYNYRYLEEIIEREFHRAKRYAHPLSLIMLDIDYFKSVNDVYGHQFGDLVLKQFARYLRRVVRRYDAVIRLAGEEFIIISPGADRTTVVRLAQRILDAVNLYNFGNRKDSLKLKLSAGVCSYPEDGAVRGMDLIDIADKILNKAKEDGGNRVYCSLDIKRKKEPALDKNYKANVEVKVLKNRLEKLKKRSNQSLIEAIFALAKTIKLKDHYTGEHVERTVHYATEVSRALNLPTEEIEHIRQAASLHDLGKIGISEKILLKKSGLSKREFELIKRHPKIAVDVLRPIQFLHEIIPLIFYHHERWDGKGYPSGLKGNDIPIGARIIALADVYQALNSDRSYRRAYSKGKVMKMIKKGAATQFDPKIVDVFLKILQQEEIETVS